MGLMQPACQHGRSGQCVSAVGSYKVTSKDAYSGQTRDSMLPWGHHYVRRLALDSGDERWRLAVQVGVGEICTPSGRT